MEVLTYAVVIVVVRKREGGGYEFLVFDVERLKGRNTGFTLVKFPGGGGRFVDFRKLSWTVRRKLMGETGLRLRLGGNVVEIMSSDFPDKGHRRHFALVWLDACVGELRNTIDRGPHRNLGVPYWLSFEELEKAICNTHWPVLRRLRELGLAI